MKRYVRSSDYIPEDDPLEFDIEIVLELDQPYWYDKVVSTIKPVKDSDGNIDEQALADYNDFITNLFGVLDSYFEVVDFTQSPKDAKTSWYFWLFAKRADGTVATKVICRLRISDHEYEDYHDPKKEHEYVEQESQKYKTPKDKPFQKWKVKSIIVNGDFYDSYDDALDSIDTQLEEYSRKLAKK